VQARSRRAFLGLGVGGIAAAGVGYAVGWPGSPEPGAADGRALPPVPVGPVAPVGMADDLCEAYAVNTKLFYNTQVYGHTDAVVELLTELGVRTVRERITTGSSLGALNQRYAMPRLAERGISWHATVGELDDWSRAQATTAEVLRLLTDYYAPLVDGDLSVLLHSLGGCNEIDGPVVDGRVDPKWADHARLMQTQLWRHAKANPLTETIPVVGPSTRTDVTVERAGRLGDLSAVSDWGNAHLYNRGGSPTRLIDEQLAILERCFPDAPRWFFTETGYNNAPEDDAGRTVSEEAAATYAVRGICDYYLRDSIYGRFELLDDPDPIDYTSQESINATVVHHAHFGLVAMTRTRSPPPPRRPGGGSRSLSRPGSSLRSCPTLVRPSDPTRRARPSTPTTAATCSTPSCRSGTGGTTCCCGGTWTSRPPIPRRSPSRCAPRQWPLA